MFKGLFPSVSWLVGWLIQCSHIKVIKTQSTFCCLLETVKMHIQMKNTVAVRYTIFVPELPCVTINPYGKIRFNVRGFS